MGGLGARRRSPPDAAARRTRSAAPALPHANQPPRHLCLLSHPPARRRSSRPSCAATSTLPPRPGPPSASPPRVRRLGWGAVRGGGWGWAPRRRRCPSTCRPCLYCRPVRHWPVQLRTRFQPVPHLSCRMLTPDTKAPLAPVLVWPLPLAPPPCRPGAPHPHVRHRGAHHGGRHPGAPLAGGARRGQRQAAGQRGHPPPAQLCGWAGWVGGWVGWWLAITHVASRTPLDSVLIDRPPTQLCRHDQTAQGRNFGGRLAPQVGWWGPGGTWHACARRTCAAGTPSGWRLPPGRLRVFWCACALTRQPRARPRPAATRRSTACGSCSSPSTATVRGRCAGSRRAGEAAPLRGAAPSS